MKKLLIEWKHFTKEGKTCERCSQTGRNLSQVLETLNKDLLGKGYEIEYKETQLKENQMPESNIILINNIPLEQLLSDTQAGENECCSCSGLTSNASNCRCRTINNHGDIYEAIPVVLIKSAITNYLKSNNKGEEE